MVQEDVGCPRMLCRTYVHAETAGQLSDTDTDSKEIGWISRAAEN